MRLSKIVFVFAGLSALILSACSEQIVEDNQRLGGTCLSCHDGITDVHPFFALSCTDCHGGNDAVRVDAAGAIVQEGGEFLGVGSTVNVRDQAFLRASHVLPVNPENWWANGIDDDQDGAVDELGEFFDPRLDEVAGFNQDIIDLDQEMNEDMNYLRFINPGDLRVSQVGCGRSSPQSNDAMICHAEVVYDMRRSMMTQNSGVATGALYGNSQGIKASDFGAVFDNEFGQDFDARNPRIGRAGYTWNYDAIDNNFIAELNAFDRDALTALAGANEEEFDDNYEAQQGPILGGQLAIDGSEAIGYPPNLDGPAPHTTRLGNPTGCRTEDGEEVCDTPGNPDNRAVDVMQALPNRPFPPAGSLIETRVIQLAKGVVQNVGGDPDTIVDAEDIVRTVAAVFEEDETPIFNPVDNVVRGFRPYSPVILPAQVGNFQFGFVDLTTGPNDGDDLKRKDPTNLILNSFNNNPFGRARSSGCTACHVRYNKLGHNEEPIDRTVADNGRQATSDLPYGMRIDLGQRWWAEKHEITREVPIENCQVCHAFVTRIDFAYAGKWENEDDDVLGGLASSAFLGIQQLGPFSFLTPSGTPVNVVDNASVWQNGVIKNAADVVTEDLNNNGELDTSINEDVNDNGVLDVGEDLNGNGELDTDLNEDANGNGALDIPDRVRREDSADGRQQKFIYGGASGALLMRDLHDEAGMECVDCHGIQDVHGDGNIYTRNWDLIQIECDDCHGTSYARANLVTTGPNGGQDLTTESTPFPLSLDNPTLKKPWFEVLEDGLIVQNSRTEPNLSWVVPQLTDEASGTLAKYSHEQPLETGSSTNPNREFAHMAPAGEDGGLECYSCHSATQPNCLTCHYQQDVSIPVGEIFYGQGDNNRSDFQLFSFTRSPFYLGVSGDVEGNKIATHRSTMQLQYSTAVGPETLVHNFMAASENNLSNIVSNPNFPHVVRTAETKTCSRCHTLLDDQGRISNDHLINEAVGQGSARFANIADWAIVATAGGLEGLDIKREERGARNVWPGFVLDDTDGVQRKGFATSRRKFTFGTGVAETNDVAYVRGVSSINGNSEGADVVILGSDDGVRVIEVTGRDNPQFPPLLLSEFEAADLGGAVISVDHTEPGTSQFRRAIFLSETELGVIDFAGALGNFANTLATAAADDFADQDPGQNGAAIVGTVEHELTDVTKVRLFGTQALVTHAGGVAIFDVGGGDLVGELGAPAAQVDVDEVTTLRPARDVIARGRFMYVATGDGGVEIFNRENATRASRVLHDLGELADSRGVTLFGTKLLVADGRHGVRIIDIVVPADPVLERTILNPPLGGAPINDATAITLATVPIRNWAIVADGVNGLRAINLTSAEDWRKNIAANERSFRLSFERQDPFTPFDPTNRITQVLTFPTDAPARSVSRGYSLDTLGDPQGNRWRDGWMLGASSLDAETVQRMRDVIVQELPGTADGSGDGLGCVARDSDFGETAATENNQVCTFPTQ